jgi:hypothetical protein
MSVHKAITAVKAAEKRLRDNCENDRSIGSDCRRACFIGGMTVISEVLAEYKKPSIPPGVSGATMKGKKQLGIIISPMEDCPKGFEELIIKGGRNRRVKICRLNEEVRKKYAPPGKPAYKGALRRRRRQFPLPGITKRDIPGARSRD